MSITTCQKVTLISCSVLCVSLFLPRMLLPRAKEDTVQKEVGPGYYPPMMLRAPLSQDSEQLGLDPVHALTHHQTVARLRGIGRKTNLMTQVIPIYGFGILLYIVYIIYKREEKLLRHLRQITELMQEGRLEGTSPEMEAEEVPYFAGWEGYPEETYPQYEEEPWNRKRCKIAPLVVTLSQPTAEALAERMEQEEEDLGPRKLEVLHEEDEEEEEEEEEEEREEEGESEGEAQQIKEEEDEEEVVDVLEEEEEEEEEDESRCLLSPPSPMLASEKKEFLGLELSTELRSHSPGKKITFSEHRDVYRYPREDACEEDKGGQEEEEEAEEEEEEESETEEEVPAVREEPDEEDPVMEAESLQFSCDVGTNPEREA
ncbi:hypothetical protein NQD34_002038, partial [Periophthalmus magnuspinnatus]